MSEENPYTAPDAVLATGQLPLNQPIILSSKGRIGRLRFLAYISGLMMIYVLLIVIIAFIPSAAGFGTYITDLSGNPTAFSVGSGAIAGILFLVFEKRRFNDINQSGWWLLLNLIPFVNFLLMAYLIFSPGTKGTNNFGPAPIENSLGIKILALGPPTLVIIVIILAAITGNLEVVYEIQ